MYVVSSVEKEFNLVSDIRLLSKEKKIHLNNKTSTQIAVADEINGSILHQLNQTENMLYAQYVSGSGSDTITFSYTIESGKYSADTERLEIFDINVASYIKDIIGNNADMQRGKLIDPPLRVEVSSIPELKNITKKYLASGIVGGEIQFTKADFLDNFSDKNNNNLKSIALRSLPSNGDLKLNGTVITDPNATIDVADLDTLSFSFDTDWTGVTSFTCVAYDDDPYQSLASEIATVTLVSNTRPVV